MRLVILGGPGSGKGTQGKQLCNKLGIPWISTGDIFRAAIAQGSELGIQAAPYVERGELVPDPIAIELIRERLMESDTENGWLLDGYPRTAFQAEELDFLLDDLGKRLNWAIWLDVPEPILIDRSLGRSREDDRPDIIRRRIELFHERTIPIMEYYDPRGRLLKIDGNQPPDEVHQNIITALKPGKTSWQRPDGRPYDRLRPVTFEKNFTRFATSSVLTRCGDTQVLCTATIQPGVPPFLRDSGQGWLTAEYRMLPSATPERQARELLKLSGRTQEIQRLIGRSLRAALDFSALGERTITIDADVLQADAGTRTASITGGYVALADAVEKLVNSGELDRSPIRTPIAAISVGLIGGEPFLDLNYPEDVAAEVDFNVVMNGELEAIELQGTAEEGSFSRHQLNQLLDLAEGGIRELLELQRQVLGMASG